jgi:hypothetical protein
VRGVLAGAADVGMAAGGLALRGSAGVGAWGAELRCGWLTSTSADLAGRPGAFSVERWPCAIGAVARLTPSASRLEVNMDAGLALGVLTISGRDLFVNDSTTRLEAGVRVGVDTVIHLGRGPFRLAPLLGVEGEYFPTVYHLHVGSSGAIADSPRVWLGATVGASWALQ